MGGLWSSPVVAEETDSSSSLSSPPPPPMPSESRKRQRRRTSLCGFSQLIPGLPDELSLQILARVPRASHMAMKKVCRSWDNVCCGAELFEVRKELRITEEWLYLLLKDDDGILIWYALDPRGGKWQRLPPMPSTTRALIEEEEEEEEGGRGRGWIWLSGNKLTAYLKNLLGLDECVVDRTPLYGCSTVVLDRCLYVLGGFLRAAASSRVWRYDPLANEWTEVQPMSTPRAYCKVASLDNKLYVVGGVYRGHNGLTPLWCAEALDHTTGTWQPLPRMPFARARVLPAAADMVKPIATGMALFQGKLCVPQSLFSWPFFMDLGGEVYDLRNGSWSPMAHGMGEGWPAKQAGTKLGIVVDGSLYTLDPISNNSSLDGSTIKVYDPQADAWRVAMRRAPLLLDSINDCESPYLLAGLQGKLHVVTKDSDGEVVVFRGDPLESESWKCIAKGRFGSLDLISCEVINM